MKKYFPFLFALFAMLSLWQCADLPKGTAIEGTVQNAANLQAFLDKVVLGQANSVLSKADINSAGKFEFSFPEGLEAGVYSIRIGAKRTFLVLNGNEKKIRFSADLNTMDAFQNMEVSGAPDTEAYIRIIQGLIARRVSSQDIATLVDTCSNPMLGAFLAYQALAGSADFLPIQKKALAKLQTAYPAAEITAGYAQTIATIEAQYQQQQAMELIKVGQPAPDIRLASPSGKIYALSDLKGKIVLLDFWASWCGPCRRENPNVVKVYKKYKDKGFTVFSVSLDGVESRALLGQAPDQVKMVQESAKQRWIEAIKQDGLEWEYHVSDLKKWEAAPAALYGVTGIPRAFMIDRNGIITSTSVRGAEAIEAEILKLL